jgi:hypothetical protein
MTAADDIMLTGLGARHPLGGVEALAAAPSGALTLPTAARIEDGIPIRCRQWRGLGYVDRTSMRLIEVLEGLGGRPATDKVADIAVGAAFGTFYGSQRLNEEMLAAALVRGPRTVSPLDFSINTFNSPGALAAMRFGWKGLNATLLSCAGGSEAVAYSALQLRRYRVQVVYAGGYDELTDFLECALRAGGPEPARAYAEATVALELTRRETATRLGRTPLATYAGRVSTGASDARGYGELMARIRATEVWRGAPRTLVLDGVGGDRTHPPPNGERWECTTQTQAHCLGASGLAGIPRAVSELRAGNADVCLTIGGGLGAGLIGLLWAQP